MNIRTPPSLNWLIDKKARLEGKISQIEEFSPARLAYLEVAAPEIDRRAKKLNDEYQKQIHLVNYELPKLKRQLEAIIVALGIHEVSIKPDLISPILPRASRLVPYGEMTRLIYTFLKRVSGTATTTEIASFIWIKYEISDDQISFVKFTNKVQKRLKNLAREGKVMRLHPIKTSSEGSWKLPSEV